MMSRSRRHRESESARGRGHDSLKGRSATPTRWTQRTTPASWFFQGIRPVTRPKALRDALAGLTLAAMNVPQALGYTRIAGTPVVTGLYTLLLPLVAFAALGSSRYLVVAADSATAAILAGGLSPLAPVASERYVALAGLVAMLTAGYLILARLFRLGFLADFLSQTVLVGFLTGVGIQVGIAVLGEMLGVPVHGSRTVEQLAQVIHAVGQVHLPTLGVSASVLAVLFGCRAFIPRLPGPLVAVVGAVVVSAAFDFSGHGIAVIGTVPGGLPNLRLPDVGWEDVKALAPVAGSCFLMIVAQSAATARVYATRHREALDENSDLVGGERGRRAERHLRREREPDTDGDGRRLGGAEPNRAPRDRGGRHGGAARSHRSPAVSSAMRARCSRIHDRRRARRPPRFARNRARESR
jgi:MFS superfamily sulfate permease-like transporter